MSEEVDPRRPTREIQSAAGPYDVAMYIAKSLGAFLPSVVIVALMGYGGWLLYEKMSALQARINDAEKQKSEAEIKKAQAEADAKGAADRARYESLLEYSKQLTDLNTVSAAVSKRLQDLVSGQIDNMKEANELAEAQDRKARNYQAQIEEASRIELANLRKQIEEEGKKAKDLTLAAGIAGYKSIKTNVLAQLRRGSVADQLIDFLEAELKEPLVENQAKRDAADNADSWEIRLVLNLVLFKKTSTGDYLDQARDLIERNKKLMQPAMADLLVRYRAFSDEQMTVVQPMIADLIADEGFTKPVRDQLLFGSSLRPNNVLTQDAIARLVKYAGDRLIEAATTSGSDCYDVTRALRSLKRLSPDTELVYSTRALQSLRGTDEEKQCMKNELEKSVNGRVPTTDLVQQ